MPTKLNRTKGKIVRHMIIKRIEEVDEHLLREMIEESLALTLEHHEMRRLRAQLER
jgi:predicted DNA-binding protein